MQGGVVKARSLKRAMASGLAIYTTLVTHEDEPSSRRSPREDRAAMLREAPSARWIDRGVLENFREPRKSIKATSNSTWRSRRPSTERPAKFRCRQVELATCDCYADSHSN